jgi:hypothetical protein
MGENHEGAWRTMLFYCMDDAVAQAEKWMNDSTFDWEEDDNHHIRPDRSWSGGCDWINVVEKEIF